MAAAVVESVAALNALTTSAVVIVVAALFAAAVTGVAIVAALAAVETWVATAGELLLVMVAALKIATGVADCAGTVGCAVKFAATDVAVGTVALTVEVFNGVAANAFCSELACAKFISNCRNCVAILDASCPIDWNASPNREDVPIEFALNADCSNCGLSCI